MNELNKKLAEWAGFTPSSDPDKPWTMWSLWGEPNPETLIQPLLGRGQLGKGLNFTSSLDACFKHLVPKAIDKIMADQECSSDLAYAILFKKWLQELELDIPHCAPTLCLAIEKLIDGEKK